MAGAADLDDLKARLIEQARALGFAAVGFAPAADDPLRARRLREWLAEGLHGEMEWMKQRADVREGPQAMWPEAQSVIALGMSYAPDSDPLALGGDPERARISAYAQGGDYHDTVKKALKALARWLVEQAPGTELKVFVDTAPVMEKPLAEAAGIGWIGKHTILVNREHGNWLFLGAIYTTLPFAPDVPHAERCGSCRACQDVCPTDAFPEPFKLDARRCISYLTIELAGSIPEPLRALIGNRIYGCDDCQLVCPWNRYAVAATATDFARVRNGLDTAQLTTLFAWDEPAFLRNTEGSAIRRIGFERWSRNIAVALGNAAPAPAIVAALRSRASDPSPVVREHVAWAIERQRTLASTAAT